MHEHDTFGIDLEALAPEARDAMRRSIAAHHDLGALPGVTLEADETVVIVVHPNVDTLDVVGPHYFLASMLGATIHLATTGDLDQPVDTAGGLRLTPTTTLADAPTPTVLLVPGGDTTLLVEDEAAIAHIRRLADAATMVASVCSGALALGAAGVLEGRRATTHWTLVHLLEGYGATPVAERFVDDGDLVTAAGVTAGMDLAIHVTGRLRGDDYARFVELMSEYAPQPPYGTGTPESAGPDLESLVREFVAPLEHALRAPAERDR